MKCAAYLLRAGKHIMRGTSVIARRPKIREAGHVGTAHLFRAGEHHGRPIRTFLGEGGGYGVRGSSVLLLGVLLLVPRRVRFFYL